MSAGLVHLFLSNVEQQRPVLSPAKNGINSDSLYWTPLAEPNFVRYELYVSSAGQDLVRDEAHKVRMTADRSANAADLSGLTSYGQYQFQLVTVLSNGSLVSDVLTVKLGATQDPTVVVIAGIGASVVMIGTAYGLKTTTLGRKFRKR